MRSINAGTEGSSDKGILNYRMYEYGGSIGIMEKKMETIGVIGFI